MRLLITFIEDKSIVRFLNFLNVIKDHRGDAKGVILNFNSSSIQAIYFYLEEKSEEVNYYEYDRKGIPYFVFTYSMQQGDPTCTHLDIGFTKEADKEYNKQNPSKDVHLTFRMNMEDFLDMHKFLARETNIFPKFYFKAKTVIENNNKQNVFLIQGDKDFSYLDRQFKVRTARKYYDITKSILNDVSGYVNVRITMRALKEIAEKWKNKLLLKKKEFSNFFLIKLSKNENERDVPLYIDFIFNSKCQFTLKYLYDDWSMDETYKFDFKKYYAVRFDQFIKVIGDYNINNYNSLVKLNFMDQEILVWCYTNGITNEEKDSQLYKYYSAYSFSINALHLVDKKDVERIMENMD